MDRAIKILPAPSSLWGSTSALDQLATLQRHANAGGAALRCAAMAESARLAMREKLAASDLTITQRAIALTILIDSALAGDEFEATGSSTAWAAKICIDRETVSSAITRFNTIGLLNILENGARHVRWRLRWLFSAEEWGAIQDDAVVSVKQILEDYS